MIDVKFGALCAKYSSRCRDSLLTVVNGDADETMYCSRQSRNCLSVNAIGISCLCFLLLLFQNVSSDPGMDVA